jgi:hypothetical protein
MRSSETKLLAGTNSPILDVLYEDNPFWYEPGLTAHDSRRLVWLQNEQRVMLRDFLMGDPPKVGETVEVKYSSPQSVELDARLQSPGIVVLADIDYPGWRLSIDDQPAPIHRVNGFMRGAAVTAGRHRLIYTYEPRVFTIGLSISVGALGFLILLAAGAGMRRLIRRPGAHKA